MSHRLQWSELPEGLQRDIATWLGAEIVEASGAQGGYSPALAARCLLADGRKVFLKAASPDVNPRTPDIMRREAALNRMLPADAPAPQMLDSYDDGTWVVLAFATVEGQMPSMPWHHDDLQRVARAAAGLAELPVPELLRPVGEVLGHILCGWSRLREAGGEDASWEACHLDELCALEAQWPEAAAGEQFIHGDVRSDNILLGADGRVTFVDWTECCKGSAAVDLVFAAPSVELEGGGSPEHFLALANIQTSAERITPIVAAITGYYVWSGIQPDPPGMPTVRAGQRAKAEIALRWLQRIHRFS